MKAPSATTAATIAVACAVVIALGALTVQNALRETAPVQIIGLPATSAIVVSVRGAVMSPGLVTLPDGARVGDAIAEAGGLAPDADDRAVNYAQRLTDEQQIVIPRRDDSPTALPVLAVATPPAPTPTRAAIVSPTRTPAPSRVLININTATADQLIALPGIADLTARRIIESRQQTPFRRIEELRERGIMNQQNFDRVREFITAP